MVAEIGATVEAESDDEAMEPFCEAVYTVERVENTLSAESNSRSVVIHTFVVTGDPEPDYVESV